MAPIRTGTLVFAAGALGGRPGFFFAAGSIATAVGAGLFRSEAWAVDFLSALAGLGAEGLDKGTDEAFDAGVRMVLDVAVVPAVLAGAGAARVLWDLRAALATGLATALLTAFGAGFAVLWATGLEMGLTGVLDF